MILGRVIFRLQEKWISVMTWMAAYKKFWIYCLALLAAWLLAYELLFKPITIENQKLNQNNQAIAETIKIFDTKANIKQELARLKQRQWQLAKNIAEQKTVLGLAQQLEQLAEHNRLQVQLLHPTSIIAIQGLTRVAINLILNGSYQAINQFRIDLAQLPALVLADDFNIVNVAIDKKLSQQKFSGTLFCYFQGTNNPDNFKTKNVPANAIKNLFPAETDIKNELQKWPAQQFKLTGFMTVADKQFALVTSPEQKVYLLQKYDILGRERGVVESVSKNEIVIQIIKPVLGLQMKERVVLSMA